MELSLLKGKYMASNANFNTEVVVSSSKSQSVIVIVSVAATVCYLVGFAFIWFEKNYIWIPFAAGTLLYFFVFCAWYKAQSDTDLESSVPTSISDSRGTTVSTDARSLKSPELIQLLNNLFECAANREPLPEPDGLVDAVGQPIPNSKAAATEKVSQANQKAQESVDNMQSIFGGVERMEPALGIVEEHCVEEDAINHNQQI
ncbi:hypothetical protein ABVF67_004232 [Vibrio parahaemolyticus]